MAGYSELAGSIGKLLRLLAYSIEASNRKAREQEYQDEWARIEADPIGWFVEHFSLPKQLPKAGEAAASKPKPRSITLYRGDTERLAKYIFQLERGM